jgi:hypothetical protein
MCNNKDDIKLTDTKSTKLDAERSKREDSVTEISEEWGCLFPLKFGKAIEMRCSELYGDIERPAEKIWPA